MKKLWEGGVGAIKSHEEIIFVFLYQCKFEEMKDIMIRGIQTYGADSKAKIYKQLTQEERENYEIINLFSIENSKTNVRFMTETTLRWITYVFISHLKPKYNQRGVKKEYKIETNKASRGEYAIEDWLIEHQIRYVKEFSYPDLKAIKGY